MNLDRALAFVRTLVDGDRWRRRVAARRDARGADGADAQKGFAQALIAELVERKLWPVALLLCVAIVAIPVFMRGDSSSDAPAGAALPPQGEVAATDTLKSIGPPTVKARPGKQLDPFRQPPKPKVAATAALATAAAPGAPSADAPSGATPSGGAPSHKTSPGLRARAAAVYYRTSVRWYSAAEAKPRLLARLTPFGGLVDTAALYLGVTKLNANYAVFLLGGNATSDGEATCEADTGCRVIGLKAGQLQLVTVQPPDGGEARQYYLHVVSVKTVRTGVASARTMRRRVHADGRDAMREMWQNVPTADALRPYQYDRDSGLVVKTTAATSAAQPTR